MRRTCLALLAALAVFVPTITLNPLADAAPVSTGLPTDPAAHGYIGLCDEAGHNVTGGSVATTPFVWKSVASSTPPAQFQGKGQNAVLNAYQPRPGVQPAQWSGSALTAASFYSVAAHPAVQATYADQSLASLIAQFPPQVNGLYVLRMYYGKAAYGLYDRAYPTTTIQVVGKQWHVVSGGTVDCGAARAVSNEQLTGVVTRREATPRTPSAATTGSRGETAATAPDTSAGPISSPPVSLTASGTASTGTAAARGQAGSQASAAGDDGGSPLPWVIALVAVLALTAGIVHRFRSRSS